jgi:hypothetical protein
LFFVFALAAYAISSLATFFSNQVENELWLEYINHVFLGFNFKQNLSTKKNKESVIAWLTTETPITFGDLANFIL